MRIRLVGSLLCAALAWSGARPALAQTTGGERSADAAAIRAHIESIFAAFVDKDRRKLEETHGANWRGFTTGSRRIIRGLDDYMKSATFPPGVPKGQGMVGYRIADFDVVFYGDTAVASFIADVDLMFGAEKSKETLTLVDVYHKEPGGWIQVASNTSYHPDSIERQVSQLRQLSNEEKSEVLKAREAVWRAWFAGDTGALGKLVPPELVTIEPGSDAFGTRESNLTGSRGFAGSGGRLVRLAFPRTEFQAYGNTVILYTTYDTEIQSEGRTRSEHGVATEIFVQQDGRWINTGWQLAPVVK